jgi:5-methylcytosine-specific restriction endonuclease McrA
VIYLEAEGARSLEGSDNPGNGTKQAVQGRVLVLNSSYQPLNVVNVKRAVILVLKDKAEVLEQREEALHSEKLSFAAPLVIRLVYLVKVPFRVRASISRRAVFARDHFACQYCGSKAESIDHVIPRSRGGLHVWENIVAACRSCNTRKENRSPREAGLTLRSKPAAPQEGLWLLVAVGEIHPTWMPYLNGMKGLAERLAVDTMVLRS